MPITKTDGTPLIRDIDLAKSMGYSRPNNIRRLIAKLIQTGELPPEGYLLIQEHAAPKGAYYLTPDAADLIRARSRTTPTSQAPIVEAPPIIKEAPPEGITLTRQELSTLIAETVKATLAAVLPQLATQAPQSKPVLALPMPKATQAEIWEHPHNPTSLFARYHFLGEAAQMIGISIDQLCQIARGLKMWGGPDMRQMETAKGSKAWQISTVGIEVVCKEAYARRWTRQLGPRAIRK